MKKYLFVLLAALLVVAMFGCGKDTEEGKDTPEQSETTGQEALPDEEDIPALTILEGGEINDNCLEMRNVFVDFTSASEMGARVEKRSETNVVLYFNEKEADSYEIQYSASGVTVGTTDRLEKVFKNGYETIPDEKFGEILYCFEEEENGIRIIVLQDIGDEQYVSIRCFDDVDVSKEAMMESMIIKTYPIYAK